MGSRGLLAILWMAAPAVACPATALATPADAGAVLGATAPQAGAVELLQEPGMRSEHAFVEREAIVRASPSPSAARVARLKRRTEDGTDELVLLLARTLGADGRAWFQVRLPIRPNNSTGWVPESALGPPQSLRTWLRIDLARLTATLLKRGQVVFRARVGIGKRRWPTPTGEFYVRSKLVGYGRAGSFYGPVAFGTSARSPTLTDWPGGGIVGVHGTSLPELIPGRISHGCVRLRNRDILRLARLMPVGTPITIA